MVGNERKFFKERPLAYRRNTCDLDGSVFDNTQAALDLVNAEYGTSYTIDQWTTWNWLETVMQNELHLTAWEIEQLWMSPGLVLAARPIPGSVEVLRRLALNGAEISFVTARLPAVREATFESFEQYLDFIPRERIHIRKDRNTRGVAFKVNTIRRLGAKAHIEDSLDVGQQLDGIPVLYVRQKWNIDAPSQWRKTWPGIYRFLVHGHH